MADVVVASGANAAMDDLPLWIQPAGGDPALNYSGITDRTLLDAIFATEGPIGGPAGMPAFKVSQRAAGANFSVDVASGPAVIAGDSVANQGKYLVRSAGVVNIPYAGGAPASGTRVHRIIARIRDKSAAGSAYDWTFEWLEDTGTGTPALPPSAISLATVSIASGQASVLDTNIIDLRRPAVSFGGEYEATQTLGSSAPTISFQNIPTYLRSLRLTWTARGDAAVVAQWLYLRINNDSIANYRWGYTQAAGSPAAVTPVQTMPDTRMVAGMLSGATALTGIFGSGTIDLEGWDSPHVGNLGMTHSGQILHDASNYFIVNGGGHYSPAGPYNRLDLIPASGGNFVAGTRFILRGK